MIIGFTGKMGVGKSTAINILGEFSELEKYPYLIKFADPLYDIQEMIYDRISDAYTRPKDFVKDRKLLQWIGTEWGRETIKNSLWVDLWKAAAIQAQERGENLIVCDDVRFNNEAEAIKSLGGTIIKIVANTQYRAVTSGIAGHKSEIDINADYVDYLIENKGSIEAFQDSLCNVYKAINQPTNK